jgi:2,2-dialkylglycine decarboxylase (pyruvate)
VQQAWRDWQPENSMKNNNIAAWEEYGDYLIPVQPFMDNVIVRTEGSFLIDIEGNRLLDLASGQFCTILGHNHPVFIERLAGALKNTLHTGSQYVTESVLRAAKRVSEITPDGLDKVIFLSTGSEANEFALRVAKTYTNRTGIAGFDRGYYGISLATKSLSTISGGHVDASPKTPETYHLIAPNCGRCPFGLSYPECEARCLDVSIRLIGDRAENIAAVIVEPIISAGGMIYPSREYFAKLKAYTQDIGALLIVDEAQTGFGRCGRWFDCENLDLVPDVLVFSKTSGNGFPAGGVVISRQINDVLIDRGFYHLSSHQNDPLTACAVSAVIEVTEAEGLVEAARSSGDYFRERLVELAQRHRHLGRVRGRGLMLAFELLKDKAEEEPYSEMLVPFVFACKKRGVHVTFSYYEGVIRLIPASTISRAEIDLAIQVFDSVLTDLEQDRLKPDYYEQQNRVMRGVARRRHPIRQTLGRLWSTSPQYWVTRLKQKLR